MGGLNLNPYQLPHSFSCVSGPVLPFFVKKWEVSSEVVTVQQPLQLRPNFAS